MRSVHPEILMQNPKSNIYNPLVRFAPGCIAIVESQSFRDLGSARAEVLFVNNPVLVHDERHYSRRTVFGWIGQEGKAAGHLPIYDITASGIGVGQFSAPM